MNTENNQHDSWGEASEPQLMLRIDRHGQVKLLPYAYQLEVTFEEGDFIRLEYTSCVVEITGRDLAEILPLLQKHYLSHLRIGDKIKEIKVSGSSRSEG
jgi:hypothetical protein